MKELAAFIKKSRAQFDQKCQRTRADKAVLTFLKYFEFMY